MKSHTPGPWKVDNACKDQTPDSIWITADGLSKAYLLGPDTPERAANARLIAAAPCLLAALKDLFAMMDEGVLVRDTSKDHDPNWAIAALDLTTRLKSAHDAIAKAEGGGV